MSKERTNYSAYLLRLWQVGDSEEWVWRASLEDAQTNELIGFRSLDHLCCYLRDPWSHSTNYEEVFDQEDDPNSA